MTRLTLLALVAVALGSAPVLAGPELTKAYVLSILKDAKPNLDACGDGLHGDVVKTRFTIATSGEVKGVQVAGKHAKDAVGACLRRELTALRFGPSLKPTPVALPLRFGDAVAAKQAAAKPDKLAKAGGHSLDQKDVVGLLQILQTNIATCGSGVVQSKFTILPNGKVRQIELAGEHARDQVGRCVTHKLATARFPQAKAPTPVSHQFNLN